ncbi:FLD [Symbiodinium sp. CCMP2592]|nr:FLD [Symbiodinium sp. CCMP2592]
MVDVAIIGAGISGISCARHLRASDGMQRRRIKVLEATSRPGGRAKTHVLHNGSTIELGAAWVHGERGNAIYDFAMRRGLLREDWMSDPEWRWEDRPMRHLPKVSSAQNGIPAEAEKETAARHTAKQSVLHRAHRAIAEVTGATCGQGGLSGLWNAIAADAMRTFVSDHSWQPPRKLLGVEASPAEKQAFEEMENAFDRFTDKEALGKQADEVSLGALLDEKFQEWAQHTEHDPTTLQTMFEFKKRELSSDVGSPDLYTVSANGFASADDVLGHNCIPLPLGYSSIVRALLEDVRALGIHTYESIVNRLLTDSHVWHDSMMEVTIRDGRAEISRERTVKSEFLDASVKEVRVRSQDGQDISSSREVTIKSWDSCVLDFDIQYDAVVTEVTSHDDHVRITLENGDKLLARTVVVTVSVGVLKSGQIRFKPELPQEKQEAIQRMGFGHVEKCILTFDNDTWETLKHGVHCLWPPERDGYRNAVLNDWERRIFALYPNQPRSSRSLVAWIVADGFSSTSAPEKVMNLLRCCLGRDVPDPVETNLTNWGRDRRFLGSWSYLSAGQSLDAFGALGKPFGRVFFGGEHTHPKYFGTAHGAYESGARCAQEVIDMLFPIQSVHQCTQKFQKWIDKLPSPLCKRRKMLDVVIVGAGISGISCAKHIRASNGMQRLIKVLEATDRPGGRAKTVVQDGSIVDLGTTWIHGGPGNVIYDFATEKGLMLDKDWMSDPNWQWEVLPLRHSHGLEASPTEKQAFDEMEKAFDGFTEKEAVGDQADEKSLGALLDEEFQKWAQQKEHDAAMMQTMFEFKKREMSSGVGSPDLYTASANGFVQAEDGFGHDCIPLPHGYSSIVRALLEEVPDLDIQYDAAVKEVTSHDNHVEITLENGDKLQARTVVFTVSVGVLKSGQIRFKPELPQEKQEAIQRMGFGHVEKCILTFDNDTWETLKHGVHCLWPPERDGYRNAVLNDWEQSIVAFYANQPRSSRSLVAWIVADGFADTSAPKKVMNLLRRCLGCDVPDPISTILTNWGRDRRFLGSWSYLCAGQALDAFGALNKPFGRVFFGGEHTHPKYFGTAHGAYESGARCAQEVIDALSRPS